MFITRRAFAFDPYNRRSDQMQSVMLKRPVFDKTAETDQEREARERRIALLAILRAMGAKPIRAARSDAGDDAYRENLVAAEEAPEGGRGGKRAGIEEAEEREGIEEEEKQISEEELDNLYEKAQKFDAALPEMEPPKEMVLELRSYQKQVITILLSSFLPFSPSGWSSSTFAYILPFPNRPSPGWSPKNCSTPMPSMERANRRHCIRYGRSTSSP